MTQARALWFRCCRTRFPVIETGAGPVGFYRRRMSSRCSRRVPRYPLAGLLLALPALEDTGCWMPPKEVPGRGSGTGFTGWARCC